jgi:hypothetical protein
MSDGDSLMTATQFFCGTSTDAGCQRCFLDTRGTPDKLQ